MHVILIIPGFDGYRLMPPTGKESDEISILPPAVSPIPDPNIFGSEPKHEARHKPPPISLGQ